MKFIYKKVLILTKYKRGSCCIRKQEKEGQRAKWVIDDKIPIFKGDGRQYIERLIYLDE